MEEFDKIAVEKFVVACNDMLSGKFLDINKKLASVLDAVSESEDVISLLADALTNFDEDEMFEKTFVIDSKTKNGKVCMPSDDNEKLAVIVTLLNDIQSRKINITQFLETYFKDNNSTPTQNFLNKILKPFRDIVCKNFGVNSEVSMVDINEHIKEKKKIQKEEENVIEEKEEDVYPGIDELMADIEKISKEIQARLKFEKKKVDNVEDIDFILNAILKACASKDLLVINGLIIGLNYASKKFKSVKYLVQDLNDTIYDYYDFLAKGAENSQDLEDENFIENESETYESEEDEEDL